MVCGGNAVSLAQYWTAATNKCHTYAAGTGTWTAVQTLLPVGRQMMALDTTNDGKVVMFGGAPKGDCYPNNETWVYTPTTTTTGTWTKKTTGVGPSAHSGPAHATLPDGRVVVFGGRSRNFNNLGCGVSNQVDASGAVVGAK